MFLQSCNSFVSLYILLLCHTTSSHLSEHLASNCTATFKYFRDRHFCLNCAIWLFGQTCKCMHPLCTLPTPPHPTPGTHTPTHTSPSEHQSIQWHTYTHVHSCGYYQRCSAEAPGLSGPHGVAVTRGGRAYLGPRPLPRPHALAPGAERQMPCKPPVWRVSVAKAYSV